MKFTEYLKENKENHAVLAFGRMNPPTVGHEKLVNKVKEIAKKVGGTPYIVLSHSHDSAKNPLTPEQKVKHAKRYFPGVKISVSDKQHPNFLAQASLLYSNGATHLHMVAGADRIGEYETTLNKYNGIKGTHGYFKFKDIEVHSAGERDPDAEGVEGMSASKMRDFAAKGNFKEFKKGVPKHVSNEYAKELFNDVRHGMGVKEDLDTVFTNLLVEGVHDKSIFKAVFLSGGPGSGKDYVLDNTLSGHGLTEINSDKALEFLMDKNKLDKTMPAGQESKRNLVRGKAKNITDLRQRLALLGRNGLIINGTGDDTEKIKSIKKRLEELGYDTAMLMVNTKDEVSQQRNIERGQRGGRTVPETIRKEKWESAQNSRTEYAKLFGQNYHEFDNSEDLRTADPDTVKAKKMEMMGLHKEFMSFTQTPPQSPVAQEWIANELNRKDRFTATPSKATDMAPKDGASEEAKRMGLSYFGFGRYGKNGKVTHHSVHGRLVAVTIEKPQEKPMNKKVNEEVLSEGVSITINADTIEELNQAFSMFITEKDYEEEVQDEESQQNESAFSDNQSLMVLTLGKGIVTESYLNDKNGKPKVFMLRRAAAKEAHLKNGEVVKNKNGYLVKLKENTNVEIFQEPIEIASERTGKTSIGWTNENERNSTSASGLITESRDSSSGNSRSARGITEAAKETTHQEECGCDACEKPKQKSFSKIKENLQSKKGVSESIDMGIEPGMALDSYSKEKIRKKDGKAVVVDEMTGDETTASIGDQKEDELKKKGISLSSFKKRNYI